MSLLVWVMHKPLHWHVSNKDWKALDHQRGHHALKIISVSCVLSNLKENLSCWRKLVLLWLLEFNDYIIVVGEKGWKAVDTYCPSQVTDPGKSWGLLRAWLYLMAEENSGLLQSMKTAQIVNGYFKHLLTNINFLLKIVIIGPTDSWWNSGVHVVPAVRRREFPPLLQRRP